VDSTDAALHPLVVSAANGILPPWGEVGERRYAHMGRVAELLRQWADALGAGTREQLRWRAAGWLHDVLRDAEPETLREELPSGLATLPAGVLHGPAAAQRLAEIGDPELLDAIRYHTVGHPDLRKLGRALFLADYLEPGRSFRSEWRSSLRDRMPHEMDDVLVEVLAARIEHLLGSRRAVNADTVEFWNVVVEDAK
jgi:HD superfamily phosphohydrolase YqeK